MMHSQEVEFDLIFEGLNEIFDYRNCAVQDKKEIYGRVLSEHLEQFGSIKGYIRIGSRTFNINALGERDHSWGILDWNAPKMWIWLTCQFSESMAFNIAKLMNENGTIDAGFIHLHGRNIPIVDVRIDTSYARSGAPQSLAMHLLDSEGRTYLITAKVLRGVALPFESEDKRRLPIMHETLAKYRYGEMAGFGIAEYLIRKKAETAQ